MPSVVLSPLQSGGFNLLSGNYFSGFWDKPAGKVLLWTDYRNSGLVYASLSGPCTVLSGGVLSESLTDGCGIPPGQQYQIPKLAFPVSGNASIFCNVEAQGSGQCRVFWEVF